MEKVSPHLTFMAWYRLNVFINYFFDKNIHRVFLKCVCLYVCVCVCVWIKKIEHPLEYHKNRMRRRTTYYCQLYINSQGEGKPLDESFVLHFDVNDSLLNWLKEIRDRKHITNLIYVHGYICILGPTTNCKCINMMR